MIYLSNCGLFCSYLKISVAELEKILRKSGRMIEMMEEFPYK